MKVVMTGGGSGGHITPILAVAHKLAQHPGIEIIFIGQRGDKLADIPAADPSINAVYSVSAGKLRRYADEGPMQWLNVRTQALNLRDACRLVAGTWQSYWLLRKLKPDVIFTRGGYVSVPVAVAGRLHHIPYITHDSDSVPSLANRLIARSAAKHAVALPPEAYPYPADKTVTVGVPVSAYYQPVTHALQARYRADLGLPADAQVIFLTGGGNGARVLNNAMVSNTRYLLSAFPQLVILHVAGRALETETAAAYDGLGLGNDRARVQVYGFVGDLYRYSGAADVVIARGGATNLAEFAIQGVACLIVPSKQLGWNVKNAAALTTRGAIMQLSEDQAEQPERLGRTVGSLLADDSARLALGKRLAEFAHPQAAAELAALIMTVAGGVGHVPTKK